MKEMRDWCDAVPPPAPARLAKALSQLDDEMARQAGQHRSAAPGRRAVLLSWRRWPRWVAPLASAAVLIAVITGTFAVTGAVRGPGPARPAAATYPRLVVVLSQRGIVTRIRDGRVLSPIHLNDSGDEQPQAIAVTPDGKTAYVAMTGGERRPGVVIPVQLATGKILKPIPVGVWPNAISLTADGKTAYVTNFLSGTVTPIATATNTALAPIRVGSRPDQVVTAPDGRTIYVARGDKLIPYRTATGTPLHPLQVPDLGGQNEARGIVVTPDSKTVYANGYNSVTPIERDHTLTPIIVPENPDSVTLAPGGRTAYVVSYPPFNVVHRHLRDTITPVNLRNGTTLPSLKVPSSPNGWGNIAIAPGGKTGYFTDTLLGQVTPINLATRAAGQPIASGKGSYTILFGQHASVGYLMEFEQVVPLNTTNNTTLRPIKIRGVMGWGEAG
jgi:YVTN family beta-propeller protein